MATKKIIPDNRKSLRIDASERLRSPNQQAVDNMPKMLPRVDWRGDAKKATQQYEKQYLRAKATGDNTYITTPKQYAKQWQDAARLGQARDTLRRAMYSPVQQANTTTNLNPEVVKEKALEDTTTRFLDSDKQQPPYIGDGMAGIAGQVGAFYGKQLAEKQKAKAAAEKAAAEDAEAAENAEGAKGAVNNPMQTGEISYSYTPPAPSNIGKLLNITGNVWDAYKKAILSKESSNGIKNISGGSGKAYDGIYQIGEAAKINAQEMARRKGIAVNPYDQTPESRQAFLENLEDQEKYFELFTIDNDRQLTQFLGDKYTSLSPDEKLAILGYAHNQGATGAAEWFKSGKGDVDGFGTPGVEFSDAVRKYLAELYAMEETVTTAPRPQPVELDRPTFNPRQFNVEAPTIPLPNTAGSMEEVNVSALRPQVAGLDRPTVNFEQSNVKAPTIALPNTAGPMEETVTSALRPQIVGLPDQSLLNPKQPNAVPPSTPTAYDQVILPNQDRNDAFKAAGTTSPMQIGIKNGTLDLSQPYSSKETDANGNPIIENAYLPESGRLTKEQTAKVKALTDRKILEKRNDKEGQYGYTRDDNIRFRGFDKFGALAFDQFTPGTGEAPEITNETLRNYQVTGVNSAKSSITPEQQAALANAYAATEAMMPRNQAAQRSALRDPFTAEKRKLDAAYKREKANIEKNNKYPSVLLKRLDDKYGKFYSDLEANRRQASSNAIAAEETAYQRNRDAKTDQIAEQERRMGNLERRMEGVVDTINRNGKKRRGEDWPGYSYAEMYAFANPAEIAALDTNTEQDLINQLPAWFGLAKAVEDESNDTVTFNDLLKENSDLVGNTRGLFDRLTSLNFNNLKVTVRGKDYFISKEDFMQYYSR